MLRLDPALADIFNTRGELWRKRATGPRRWPISATAIKLNPEHPAARANYKSLAQELERLGALIAVAGKPSFYCKTARRAVEKAICANPELADLDREIHAMNVRVISDAQNIDDARKLQREQEAFIARRNAEFGRPGYDLRKAMKSAAAGHCGRRRLLAVGREPAGRRGMRAFEPPATLPRQSLERGITAQHAISREPVMRSFVSPFAASAVLAIAILSSSGAQAQAQAGRRARHLRAR